ncbi:hypothetical protein [Hahella ganghwensis]|uniref:hypothetical protein n=1 Tax=Hahella ganghwensis TaxID=286420 RepID=UPI00036A7679|nr:hypothetical protein [Hahella ganghwensis]
MKKPPNEIDGAKVLEWAWSGDKPFGALRYESGEIAAKIFGLAICSYPGSKKFYRFSCDSEWKTEQDSDYNSINEAKEKLPSQYQGVEVIWQIYEL